MRRSEYSPRLCQSYVEIDITLSQSSDHAANRAISEWRRFFQVYLNFRHAITSMKFITRDKSLYGYEGCLSRV